MNIADGSDANFIILCNFNPCLNVFETLMASEPRHERWKAAAAFAFWFFPVHDKYNFGGADENVK